MNLRIIWILVLQVFRKSIKCHMALFGTTLFTMIKVVLASNKPNSLLEEKFHFKNARRPPPHKVYPLTIEDSQSSQCHYDQRPASLLLILQSDISPDLPWTSRTVKAPNVTLWPESSVPLTNTTIWYIPWLTMNIKDSQSSQCHSMTRVECPSY